MPTVPVIAIVFPARTARAYPIFDSHGEPLLARRRPFDSVTVILMSFAMAVRLIAHEGSDKRRGASAPATRA